MAGRATISQLGSVFGKHPAWIRHHVKTLEAAGLVSLVETRTVRNYTEKYYAATAPAFVVDVAVRPTAADGALPIIFASSDFALAILAGADDEDPRALTAVTGSLDSLIAVRQGLADIAGCHLLDAPSGEYNVPYVRHLFPDRSVIVTTLADREQGLIVAAGNPLALTRIADVAQSGVRFMNRNRGSGTRVWLDIALQRARIDHDAIAGYSREVDTHALAAAAVAQGSADVALGIRAAAEDAGVGFVPLFTERYDLVMPTEVHDSPAVAPLLDRLHGAVFRSRARQLSGYDTTRTGTERHIAV
jgi:putative molybdopterin biosynthesis protein